MDATDWTAEELGQLSRGYQASCVLAAAADLDLVASMGDGPFTAAVAAVRLRSDLRGMTILLDAMAALRLIGKSSDRYHIPETLRDLLDGRKPGNQLAMAQHHANCLRRWTQLASVVRTGHPAARQPSIRGEQADHAAFIEAMDNVSGPVADRLIAEIRPLAFRHLLDVGGGSGTWTLALLRAYPEARATLFDLPAVIPLARQRVQQAGLAERVTLAAGDYTTDPLPGAADLAWLSAIVHQNSRLQNRQLFARVFAALENGGRVLIRDILMDESRTAPATGALFAVNMLVGTERGGTFTFEELRHDLESAGFVDAQVRRRDPGMHSIISAGKP